MAGVKGKSGGARVGAGRKKNPENEGAEYAGSTQGLSALETLEYFMADPEVPLALRIKSAGLVAPFRHKKLGEGAKPGANDSATPAEGSKYKTRTGPGASTKH